MGWDQEMLMDSLAQHEALWEAQPWDLCTPGICLEFLRERSLLTRTSGNAAAFLLLSQLFHFPLLPQIIPWEKQEAG